MPWFRTRPSFPAEIFFPVSLPRPQLADESASQVSFAQGGVGGISEGRRGQAGKRIGHIIFPQAGRSLVPPMRACAPCPLQNPDPNPPGLLLFETRAEKKLQFAGTAFSSAFSRPACTPHGPMTKAIRDKKQTHGAAAQNTT